MRESIKEFVQICAETLPLAEPIYEFGALQVEGMEGFADLRPLFPNKQYLGADMRPGLGVDVVLDLHQIDLAPKSVGTVLIMDTLEHVEYPGQAVQEAHRILKEDGVLIISSVMNFPIHSHPNDYWRFTPEAFKSILKPFVVSYVDFAGDEIFPHTIVGVGSKNPMHQDKLLALVAKMVAWKNYWYDPRGKHNIPVISKRRAWLRMLTPPIVADVYRKLRYGGA
jgi:SAM-dependent methyltransferase